MMVEVETAVSIEKKKSLTRRRFLQVGGLSAAGLALYAGEIARHELSIENRTFTLPRLADSFRGFRIVQISDIHYAEYTEPFFVKRVVEAVNRLQADVVVLTGDFISYGPAGKKAAIYWSHNCAQLLRAIECPQRFAVMGNHDCIVSCDAITEAVEGAGIPVLNNRAVPMERDGQRLWIAGVSDPLVGNPDLKAAVPKSSRTDREAVILLAHEPDYVSEVVPYGVDLMLSGHTHGGQVRIPFLPPMFLPTMGREYIEGLFHLGPTQLYVNRGIGAVGLPFRFRCPPEITHITLA